jgi:hypothetical protein
MRYLLAFITAPLAVLVCGRWFDFFVNLILWLLNILLIFFRGFGIIVWLIVTAYASAICRTASLDRRLNRVLRMIPNDSVPAPWGAGFLNC